MKVSKYVTTESRTEDKEVEVGLENSVSNTITTCCIYGLLFVIDIAGEIVFVDWRFIIQGIVECMRYSQFALEWETNKGKPIRERVLGRFDEMFANCLFERQPLIMEQSVNVTDGQADDNKLQTIQAVMEMKESVIDQVTEHIDSNIKDKGNTLKQRTPCD